MSQDIDLTLFHPPTGKTDAISLPTTTTLSDLAIFATALLGLDDDTNGVVLTKDGPGASGGAHRPFYHPRMATTAEGTRSLTQCGIGRGSFISVFRMREVSTAARPAPPPAQRRTPQQPASGGLDFSALLGSHASSSSSVASGNSSNNNSSHGGLSFNLPGLFASTTPANVAAATPPAPTQPIQWDGMNLDDAISRNPNPLLLMTILSDTTRHPNLLKELNYHNPTVVKKLMTANGDIPKMATIWRETMMKSTTSRFLQRHLEQSKETAMRKRLEENPMDEEANKFFGEKIRLENVQRQYEQMMEDYPESMGRVLMLYMNVLVNEKPLQVFVDSGAQNTIMSSACADRLGLLHLVDNRFSGTAVGVGTGKILGKIHIVDMTIGGYAFPCSITVMDSESGLGDKNMDCLFGLDMLKRHRCSIDLSKNVLVIPLAGGEVMEAPFLHEKDLPVSKGGTMGFDAERENAEMEAVLAKREKEEEEGKGDKGNGKGGDAEGGDKKDAMDESK